MSLGPGTRLANPYPETPPDRGLGAQLEPQACPLGLMAVHNQVKPVEEATSLILPPGVSDRHYEGDPLVKSQVTPVHRVGSSPFLSQAFLQEQEAYQDAKYPRTGSDLWAWQPDETQAVSRAYCIIPHCCEPEETPPPHTESQVRLPHPTPRAR